MRSVMDMCGLEKVGSFAELECRRGADVEVVLLPEPAFEFGERTKVEGCG